jgi:hypothetical protein
MNATRAASPVLLGLNYVEAEFFILAFSLSGSKFMRGVSGLKLLLVAA